MTFFQNSNTLTSPVPPVPPLTTIGFDSIPSVLNTDWGYFLSNPIHSERREAFKEFVYLMVYHRNRGLEGVKFPHNVLFEKVLKFYVKTTPSPSTGFPIPTNDNGTAIFTETTVGGISTYSPTSTTLVDTTPVLREQPTTADPTPTPVDIQMEVNIALATGNTSVGFFEEVATLFAHFYLMRQLTIFNGHSFEFNSTLFGSSGNYESKVIRKAIDEDRYVSSPSIAPILSARTMTIINKVDVVPSIRPYFFNSLFDTLLSLGFQIPSTPITTPLAGYAYSTVDHEKIFLAYFVKVLDPTRFMGFKFSPRPVSVSGAAFSISPMIFRGSPHGTNWDLKNTITSVPRGAFGDFLSKTQNSFIKDLFILIRSGNYVPDLGGAGGNSYSSVPKRPFFINSTSLPFGTSLNDIYPMVQRIYKELTDTTQRAIQLESQAILSYFFDRSDIDAQNTILASGIGETTVSILGIRNWGLPFFNYEMATNGDLSLTNSSSTNVSLEKRVAFHVGVYALDLSGAPPSKFEIKVDGIENYKFLFIPEPLSAGVTDDLKISPVSIPYTSGIAFYNIYNSTTEIWSYYRIIPRIVASGSGVPELIAEYHVKKRDLIFREFSPYEIKSIYDFKSIYGSRNSKPIEYKVQSSKRSDLVTEELLTLISIYEDLYPGIISDDSIYENDTFQLYGSFASGLGLNGPSYNRLLTSTNEVKGLQLIFDLIDDGAYAVNFLPPVLVGSYVGQIPTSSTGISATGSSAVIADTSYQPKYSAGTNSEVTGVPIGQEAIFSAIKYSWGQFTLTQTPAYPAIPNTIDVQIEIKSFVNPSISYLESNINPSTTPVIINGISTTPSQILIDKKVGGAVNNQVLAMLRSFGLLEGVVEKIKVMAASHPANAAILTKLDDWLPAVGSTSADAILCIDEVLSGATVLAANMRLSEYYALRKP